MNQIILNVLYNCVKFQYQIQYSQLFSNFYLRKENELYFRIKMKSIFRIYAKTSKGNDNYLLNQLKQLNLKPKYDQHLNSFYFNSTFRDLFDISFKCMTVEQMYVQIGQKFRLIDQQQIKYQLEKLPFKNYIPIQRGLIESTTLKILIRQSSQLPSQNVLISLFQNCLNKQIIKKQYYKNILQPAKFTQKEKISNINEEHMKIEENNQSQESQISLNSSQIQRTRTRRKTNQSFYQIRDIVERKWFQQDLIRHNKNQNNIFQLENNIKSLQQKQIKLLKSNKIDNFRLEQRNSSQSTNLQQYSQQDIQSQIVNLKKRLAKLKQFDKQNFLQEQLAYHPHLIFYIRNNKGRFLLKINKDQLYKHGWKASINYGPIRQSIAASILHRSKILKQNIQNNKSIKLWDPMCGSGTIPLVAATLLDRVPIRTNIQKLFYWQHWPIFKQKYLQEYKKEQEKIKKQQNINYQLILSDKDRQALNYSINNFRILIDEYSSIINKQLLKDNSVKQKQNHEQKCRPLFPYKTFQSETLQLIQQKIGFACGDFQKVIKLLLNRSSQDQSQKQQKLNIITNLPYIHGRSQQKHPLNQLLSVYKRFSTMINEYKQYIDNVFIIVDRNINDRNHFLNISSQKWILVNQYVSGGAQIGLYAWSQNKIKCNVEDNTNQMILLNNAEFSSQQRQLVLKKQKSLEKSLIAYRNKLSQIDRKYYKIPKYLTKDAKGWKRILQKRRKRHLQSAYQIFARRRDKLIALKQYARQKLQLKLLKRGTVWKGKNLNLFNHEKQKLKKYENEIKQMFETKIQNALKREQEYQQRRKLKQGNKVQVAKIRNKWNNDPKYMVKQIKRSQSLKKQPKYAKPKLRK